MSILQFYPTFSHESERQTSEVIWLHNKTAGLRLFSLWKAYWSYFCPALISKISALDLGKIMCVIWHPSHVVCYSFKTLSSIDIIIPIPIQICLSMMIPIYLFGFISNRYQYISVWLHIKLIPIIYLKLHLPIPRFSNDAEILSTMLNQMFQ